MAGSNFPTVRRQDTQLSTDLVSSLPTNSLDKPVIVCSTSWNGHTRPADPLSYRERRRETGNLRNLSQQAGQVVTHFFTAR